MKNLLSLSQVPEILRSIPAGKVFRMRQQTQVLWERYLCSVEKIVMTTLEVSDPRRLIELRAMPDRDRIARTVSDGLKSSHT